MSRLARSSPYALAPSVAAAAAKLGGGMPGEGGALQVRLPLWHRLPYLNTGLSPDGNTTFTFFQEGSKPFVSNFPGKGGVLPAGYTFHLHALCLGVIPGIDANGNRVAASALSSATAATAVTVAEELRTIHEAPAEISLTFGTTEIVNGCCLAEFPLGMGWTGFGATGPSAGSQSIMASGVPSPNERFRLSFPEPVVLPGNQSCKLSVRFNNALTLVTGTAGTNGTFLAMMDGVLTRTVGA